MCIVPTHFLIEKHVLRKTRHHIISSNRCFSDAVCTRLEEYHEKMKKALELKKLEEKVGNKNEKRENSP